LPSTAPHPRLLPPDRGRAAILEGLQAEPFDLLVVGGGILGAAIAARGSELGLDVALVDRGDFGSGTSSASSKLIHGGLRYLRMGDVRLVREALGEAEELLAFVAPHLVRRQRFLLPVYEDGPYGRATVRAALGLYRLLSGSRASNAFVPGDVAASLVPSLRLDGLRGVGIYGDAQTDDARLCLANVRAAADRGAVVANYVEVVSIDCGRRRIARVGVADRVSGERYEIEARTLVNAAGPWIDEVRRLADPSAGTSVTLSKGAHLVVEAPSEWRAAITIPIDASRVSFAVPWEGALLLGTTDDLYWGDPDDLEVTDADEARILAEVGRVLDREHLGRERILARFAGLRVLPAVGARTSAVRRETTVVRERSGLVTVAGGKLTTYRRIAAAALEELRPELGLHEVGPSPSPLPGAVDPRLEADAILRSHPGLGPGTAAMLARAYGSRAADVLSLADAKPSLLEPLATGVAVLAAQVVYARAREWAVTAEDVLRRRTTLRLTGHDSPELHARVDRLLAEHADSSVGCR
jgi:glycerol-3-phosphate dehydrogenase